VSSAPLARLAMIVIVLQTAVLFATAESPTPSLDFEYYRTRVEPIFLKKHPGHAWLSEKLLKNNSICCLIEMFPDLAH
jgi:hypothetical protein